MYVICTVLDFFQIWLFWKHSHIKQEKKKERKKETFSSQKSKMCCYGNCAYQCVWLKVCFVGIMAQTSFWSYVLSHSLLIKSLCYFCAWSPFFSSLPINVLDISFQPAWDFHRHVDFLKVWGKRCQLTPSPRSSSWKLVLYTLPVVEEFWLNALILNGYAVCCRVRYTSDA